MIKSGIANLKQLYKLQVIRFLAVGVLSVLIEFVLFALLVNILHVEYMRANLMAMSVSILCNYVMSCNVVFDSGRSRGKVTFSLFMLFTLAGLLLNQFLLWFLVEKLIINVMAGKVLAIGTVAFFNFFTKKHIVFKA
jgi:putative flippase GtrA